MNKLKIFLTLAFCLCAVCTGVFAQTKEETEPAQSSALTGNALPANAQRVLPGSVPAEINDTLDKIVAGGNGRLERGETEVIVWGGAGYNQAKAAQITQQLQAKWKAAGWTFEIGGEENGMALFTLLKDGATRRAIVGFYGGDNEAYVLALSELRQTENVGINTQTEAPQKNSKSNESLRDLVGKWERKQGGMGSVDANTGRYLGSSGNYEAYEIFPDGRVAYTMLVAVQNYGCRLEAFSQSKGRLSLSGGNLTFNLNPGTIRRDDTCSPSKNYTKGTDATNFSYNWTLGDDGYGNTELCLTQGSGEKFCYRRAK